MCVILSERKHKKVTHSLTHSLTQSSGVEEESGRDLLLVLVNCTGFEGVWTEVRLVYCQGRGEKVTRSLDGAGDNKRVTWYFKSYSS